MTAMSVRRALADERGLVVSSVVKLLVSFTLLGVAANEIGQMIMTKIHVENAAAAAAQAGANTWAQTSSMFQTRDSAQAALVQNDPTARMTSVQVDQQGAVRVLAKDTANTLILKRVSFLKNYGIQTGDEEETRGP
jgi:Flp pilus assembly protein TadG